MYNCFEEKLFEKGKKSPRIEHINNKEFEKYKVEDKFELNLPRKFIAKKLRKKLFSIKCPATRKNKDGTLTRPKTFQIFLINCNHWITWTCQPPAPLQRHL